ncbi:MAG: stage II sporulation protein R [Firmicutes bacterium]|nr:stage II sporulation protein R [Bacillota bacterium]
MKKIIILLFFISLIVIATKKEEDIIIPNNAIRFRVIANSNTLEDQSQKLIIKDKIETEVYKLINGADNTGEVRDLIENNIDIINEIVESYNVPYSVNYGYNYFPTKNYKGVMYKAGNYESLVITLGEGLGNNFWCVLFPPLCLLDNNKDDVSEVKYKLYVKELLDKF